MGKQFSIQDGNLSNAPITTSVKRTNSDIDCSFERNLTTNDVYKKTEAAAVRQSIKNLLMTNRGSVPFKPVYGGDLESFLFQLDTEDSRRLTTTMLLQSSNTASSKSRTRRLGIFLFFLRERR